MFNLSQVASITNFYSSALSSSIKKIDSLEVLINQKQFELAHTLLNEFVDTNTIESNYKKIFSYYIKLMLWGTDSIDDGDKEELNAIANDHPLLGGKSIYMARTILNLEVNDNPLSSSSRIMQPKQSDEQITLRVYPNPANETVYVMLSNNLPVEEIMIRDVTGRLCSKSFSTTLINTSKLMPGVYFLNVKSGDHFWIQSLIINR